MPALHTTLAGAEQSLSYFIMQSIPSVSYLLQFGEATLKKVRREENWIYFFPKLQSVSHSYFFSQFFYCFVTLVP